MKGHVTVVVPSLDVRKYLYVLIPPVGILLFTYAKFPIHPRVEAISAKLLDNYVHFYVELGHELRL